MYQSDHVSFLIDMFSMPLNLPLQGFTYPPHVGLSIGTSIDPVYVLMEVHYDNPAFQQGIVHPQGHVMLHYKQ